MGVEMPVDEALAEWAKGWWVEASRLLVEGKLRAHNPDVRRGGLDGVLKGLDDYRQKKVSGQKLVYEL